MPVRNRHIPWIIEIKRLKTQLRLGALGKDANLQEICIDITIRAITPAFPQSITDCMNYQPICRWIVEAWPKLGATPLLASRAQELVAFIFDFDSRVESVDVAISKSGSAASQRIAFKLSQARGDYLGRTKSAFSFPAHVYA
jgi:dihydroneopterin aldolase